MLPAPTGYQEDVYAISLNNRADIVGHGYDTATRLAEPLIRPATVRPVAITGDGVIAAEAWYDNTPGVPAEAQSWGATSAAISSRWSRSARSRICR